MKVGTERQGVNGEFKADAAGEERSTLGRAQRLVRLSFVRELSIVLAFCLFTAILTWPYVTRLHDAVADTVDPYLVAWTLWWDYHATFTDPLNLFHANIFYPLRYTLAFSEHCYGIALLCFPLFALGLRPLTVHAIAIFFGFALCGYGAFRLARTLTGSSGAAWVTGIVFAFIPYRFQLMSVLPYLFSVWVPLLFEALVLFARARTTRRAAWLGFAFFMTGLTTASWLWLSLVPLALSAAVVLTRNRLWGDSKFWRYGGAACGLASLALLPFMLPYLIVSKLYGFTRKIEEIQGNSARPFHWLAAHATNKLWGKIHISLPNGTHRLFPGLLSLLLSLAALLPVVKPQRQGPEGISSRRRWLTTLDGLAVVLLFVLVFAAAFDLSGKFSGSFNRTLTDCLPALLLLTVIARVSIAYPKFLRWSDSRNLIETLRSPRRTTAFWLGLVLTVVGFCYSLGWNFFFYRLLFDILPFFKSMREPRRGAMFAYLGLALLAGLGAQRATRFVMQKWSSVRPAAVYVCVCALLLFELNAAPLGFMRGDALPDAVTLRLKQTPMRGGVVVLPAGPGFDTRQDLRAADHAKPLIVGMSGFTPPHATQIEQLTSVGPITSEFLELLERTPASYLVVQTNLIPPEQRTVYETFLARTVAWGRLRFVNRFDGRDDLYAVVKTEPEATSEGPLPFGLPVRDWGAMVEDDPVNVLGSYLQGSQKLFRLHVASFGGLPRYADFVRDVQELGHGVVPGFDEDDKPLVSNFSKFTDAWTRRPAFSATYHHLTDEQYVSRLYENAGINADKAGVAALTAELVAGRETRAGVLVRVVEDRKFVDREDNRSFVVLHFFGYLRRDPEEPPDNNLDGLLFWIRDLEQHGHRAKIPIAFRDSIERRELLNRLGNR